ncbi:MAG TPA: ABC transporter substrate-binding protein [Candidatus Binatia bacterium]|jgi:ABC-type nitrate/sulfonate/bicarbonate transport system substrate-binding protein
MRRIIFLAGAALFLALSCAGFAASSPAKVRIHIPSKSLALMPFYFGKDKGFFPREVIDVELIAMSPPTAVAALVAGELDFSTTLGASTSAIMQGHSLKRIFYVQHEPAHVLVGQPEIKSVKDLVGKVISVNAITDATGMSAKLILKANGVDPARVTMLSTGVTETAYKSLTTGKVAATMLAPPFAQELEAKGYSHLADARAYAPLSFIGLVAQTAALKKTPAKAQAMIAGLLKTLAFIHDTANRGEMVRYIAAFHKIETPLAEKAFAAILPTLSSDGTKPRAAVEKEIEIYRETLKIAKTFTPDDLEDMSMLRKVTEAH